MPQEFPDLLTCLFAIDRGTDYQGKPREKKTELRPLIMQQKYNLSLSALNQANLPAIWKSFSSSLHWQVSEEVFLCGAVEAGKHQSMSDAHCYLIHLFRF